MTRLAWDTAGSRDFEIGIDRGVLYPPAAAPGVPWNGLTAVNEAPTGADVIPYYIDGMKYLQVALAEDYSATLNAFSAPAEFGPCDGSNNKYAGLVITQQPRKQFGLCYRTLAGNDVDGVDHGYKLHLIYNALAKPTTRNHVSYGTNADPMELSWGITTVPMLVPGFKPTSHLVIDSRTAAYSHLVAIETILYGSTGLDPRMPTVAELFAIFASEAVLYPGFDVYPAPTLYPTA